MDSAEKRSGNPVISLVDIAVRIGARRLLEGTSWQILPGQQWAVMGPNGAGKSTLVRAVAGELPIVQGRVARGPGGAPDRIGYVSFDLHRRLIAREEARDDARDFSGDWGDLTRVRQLFGPDPALSGASARAARRLGIAPLLDRTIRTLSTGEMRKVLIARALARGPELLVLDEPFDGLDAPSRRHLTGIVGRLMREGTQIILVTHRRAEVPPEATHLLEVSGGRVAWQGARNGGYEPAVEGPGPAAVPAPSISRSFGAGRRDNTPFQAPPVLIKMRRVNVRYGSEVVLADVDWTVRRGENWAVLGPNGAGKTTLLGMIAGDHPQAYANEIYLFGRRRGSGESIWEVKAPIGMITPEFQIRYRKDVTAQEVVLSGFHDSVGLYRRCSPLERETARDWLRHMGVADRGDRPFPHLSHGEQRLVLLARAMVKSPALLILDEPCQGLDRENRRRFLTLIEAVGRHTPTHLLYVTHHSDEIPACITHVLRLGGGRRTAVVEKRDADHS
jgi:molybdate transport system ATP-binding protein